ncbi:unnamed protein product [Cuscuta epithymum]|uniref:Uncharacterized protein n=1 Tax=Cuscuta epithymum TaxID=186058 RepID=A0AAV0EZE7_9ASTE|nr:unnamed protein product [Cuscuta epithymum]
MQIFPIHQLVHIIGYINGIFSKIDAICNIQTKAKIMLFTYEQTERREIRIEKSNKTTQDHELQQHKKFNAPYNLGRGETCTGHRRSRKKEEETEEEEKESRRRPFRRPPGADRQRMKRR